jgi:outer membrane protein insertion porin family
MSFKLKGTVGFADSYGDKKFPFFKNFFMGGTNTVRGYDQASVGEKTLNASTGALETTGGKKSLLGSAELFFPPPGLKNVKSFRLSTFIDGGGAFKDSIDLDEARFSAGVGAVWLSPFGPLSITYAKALNDGINDKLSTLQFGMGGAF